MKKIVCEECKKKIDVTNKHCPYCGFKNDYKIELNKTLDDICSKCGNKYDKQDTFCPKCGNKRVSIKDKANNYLEVIKILYKRNRKIVLLSLIILIVIIIAIVDDVRFNNDIYMADSYYNNREYDEAEDIIDKYPLHYNNEIYRKIKSTYYLTTYYNALNLYDDKTTDDYIGAIRSLIRGYERCEEELEDEKREIERKAIEELKQVFKSKLYYDYDIEENLIEELISMSDDEQEEKLKEIANIVKKNNTCLKNNIKVTNYYSYDGDIDITLKNNNGCSWKITSYSKVMVYFTDGSYEDVYLGINVNIKGGEQYTFKDCYLGYKHKSKIISMVTFID